MVLATVQCDVKRPSPTNSEANEGKTVEQRNPVGWKSPFISLGIVVAELLVEGIHGLGLGEGLAMIVRKFLLVTSWRPKRRSTSHLVIEAIVELRYCDQQDRQEESPVEVLGDGQHVGTNEVRAGPLARCCYVKSFLGSTVEKGLRSLYQCSLPKVKGDSNQEGGIRMAP